MIGKSGFVQYTLSQFYLNRNALRQASRPANSWNNFREGWQIYSSTSMGKWPGKPVSGKALIEMNAADAALVASTTSKRRALPFVGEKVGPAHKSLGQSKCLLQLHATARDLRPVLYYITKNKHWRIRPKEKFIKVCHFRMTIVPKKTVTVMRIHAKFVCKYHRQELHVPTCTNDTNVYEWNNHQVEQTASECVNVQQWQHLQDDH